MTVDPNDPTTWPAETIVVRCGSAQDVRELSERLWRDGSWSVFTDPGASLVELARSCRKNQIRATVGALLDAGGTLRRSPGPPFHHDLHGLTPQQFDVILSVPEPNPVPKPDRWTPS